MALASKASGETPWATWHARASSTLLPAPSRPRQTARTSRHSTARKGAAFCTENGGLSNLSFLCVCWGVGVWNQKSAVLGQTATWERVFESTVCTRIRSQAQALSSHAATRWCAWRLPSPSAEQTMKKNSNRCPYHLRCPLRPAKEGQKSICFDSVARAQSIKVQLFKPTAVSTTFNAAATAQFDMCPCEEETGFSSESDPYITSSYFLARLQMK
eukprot:5187992-Pleurochrysis_carterae.AAC.1